eukprot:363169-Chlamydomonas_euryale.AAC.20
MLARAISDTLSGDSPSRAPPTAAGSSSLPFTLPPRLLTTRPRTSCSPTALTAMPANRTARDSRRRGGLMGNDAGSRSGSGGSPTARRTTLAPRRSSALVRHAAIRCQRCQRSSVAAMAADMARSVATISAPPCHNARVVPAEHAGVGERRVEGKVQKGVSRPGHDLARRVVRDGTASLHMHARVCAAVIAAGTASSGGDAAIAPLRWRLLQERGPTALRQLASRPRDEAPEASL